MDRERSSHSHASHRSRRGSPSPPRPPRPRHENELPSEFGNEKEKRKPGEKILTVLDRMYNTYAHRGPLSLLYRCMDTNTRVKVWTCDSKDMRGILTGEVVAFDKHWNLYLENVEEVWLKRKKGKTPYLMEVDTERAKTIPNMKPKVPRIKKEKPEVEPPPPPPPPKPANPDDEPKKKQSKKHTLMQREVSNLFIRGSSIAMVGEHIAVDD